MWLYGHDKLAYDSPAFDQPYESELTGLRSVKSMSMDEAVEFYRDYSYVTRVLNRMNEYENPINRYKYKFVDVKLHDLKRGDFACLPPWHFDGGSFKEPNDYQIFITGHAALTRVLKESIYVDCITKDMMLSTASHEFDQYAVENTLPYTNLPSARICRYTTFTPHAAQSALYDERRLLIRCGYTNQIVIHDKNFKIGYY